MIYTFIILFKIILSLNSFNRIQALLNQFVEAKITPGGALSVIQKNQTVYSYAFGTYQYQAIYSQPVTLDTIFDLDTLTKNIAILPILMQLYQKQQIHLTDKVSKFIISFERGLKGNTTLQNLLLEDSGLSNLNQSYANQSDFIKKVISEKANYKRGTKTVVSDLNYVVLGEIVKRKKDKTLLEAVFQSLTRLGLRKTNYSVKSLSTNKYKVAPGGYSECKFQQLAKKKLLQGELINPIGQIYDNGIAPNAGLFSPISEVAKFVNILLNNGTAGFYRYFKQQTIKQFTKIVKLTAFNNTRTRGFQGKAISKKMSNQSYGNVTPGGSMIWIDPINEIGICFLSNGLYPSQQRIQTQKTIKLLSQLSDVIYQVLGH